MQTKLLRIWANVCSNQVLRCLQCGSSPQTSHHMPLLTQTPVKSTPHSIIRHHFFSFPSFNKTSDRKRKQYAERRLLGYSMEEMYEVVADIDQYRHFVPWCTNSTVTARTATRCQADMVVGFPPFRESYTAHVVLQRPHLVRSECLNGKLFDELLTIWKFSAGLPNLPHNTCTLDFVVSFQFRSQLHSSLSTLFFDEVVRTMVNAFLRRVESLHGPASIPASRPQIIRYRS